MNRSKLVLRGVVLLVAAVFLLLASFLKQMEYAVFMNSGGVNDGGFPVELLLLLAGAVVAVWGFYNLDRADRLVPTDR
jgi:hypothetical protein